MTWCQTEIQLTDDERMRYVLSHGRGYGGLLTNYYRVYSLKRMELRLKMTMQNIVPSNLVELSCCLYLLNLLYLHGWTEHRTNFSF